MQLQGGHSAVCVPWQSPLRLWERMPFAAERARVSAPSPERTRRARTASCTPPPIFLKARPGPTAPPAGPQGRRRFRPLARHRHHFFRNVISPSRLGSSAWRQV